MGTRYFNLSRPYYGTFRLNTRLGWRYTSRRFISVVDPVTSQRAGTNVPGRDPSDGLKVWLEGGAPRRSGGRRDGTTRRDSAPGHTTVGPRHSSLHHCTHKYQVLVDHLEVVVEDALVDGPSSGPGRASLRCTIPRSCMGKGSGFVDPGLLFTEFMSQRVKTRKCKVRDRYMSYG